MDRNQRVSSAGETRAFSESFSCAQFGAFGLDLDEADFEAMAAEAETKAQERINKAKGIDTVIDGLPESDATGWGGIHINAPNATIDTIVEQKGESMAPPSKLGREGIDMPGSDSLASLLKDVSVSQNDPSLDTSDKSKREDNTDSVNINIGRVREEEVSIPKKEADIQPWVMSLIQRAIRESDVPKFVPQASAISAQTEPAMPGDATEDPKPKGVNLDCLSNERNESRTTMTESVPTNMSRKGGQTASTASMSGSLSTNKSKEIPEISAPKTTEVTTAPPLSKSQPYDLSELLNSLCNPANPKPSAKHRTTSASRTSQRSRSSSESSGSGVFTAGFTSYYSGEFDLGKSDVAQRSNAARPSLSEIDEKSRMSEGDIHRSSKRGPASKSASSSCQNDNEATGRNAVCQPSKSQMASQHEAKEVKAHGASEGPTPKSRSISRRISTSAIRFESRRATVDGKMESARNRDEFGDKKRFNPKSLLRSQRASTSVINVKFNDQVNSSSGNPRPLSRGRRHKSSRDINSSLHVSQIKKYTIGDNLQSENDIMCDSTDVKLLLLDVFDYVFVRRSGGRWTYAIVIEVSKNQMVFVLDKKGSKKKIERHALLPNVRRLKYAECFKGNKKSW
mmetsp:Transcript_5002/g.11435  ORF Transcript_5002/g.11435 Transcript_5002/m.11435 type:complete len:624 (+) Transcript_5002:90-1961(+)